MNNFNGLNKKIVFFISISIIVTLIGVIMAITNNLSSTNISQEENSSSSNQTENESNENEAQRGFPVLQHICIKDCKLHTESIAYDLLYQTLYFEVLNVVA